jgi:hypothetical protein
VRQWLTPSQDDISPTGQNSPLYRSATSAPSTAQARAGATHAPENLIIAITSPRHPRPPTDVTGEPRTLLAACKTDIPNARDQKGSSLIAPRPLPSRPGRARISPPQKCRCNKRHCHHGDKRVGVAMGGGGREEGGARSEHARRTHVMSRCVARTGPRMSTGGGASGGGMT